MEPQPKRRKVRKGTHSCWECKRRKAKCIFPSPTESTCVGCQSRGTSCVSQELEYTAPLAANPMARVEALIERLVKKADGRSDEAPTQYGIHTPGESPGITSQQNVTPRDARLSEVMPASSSTLRELGISIPDLTISPSNKRHAEISKALHAAFPAMHDARILLDATQNATLCLYQTLTKSERELAEEGVDTCWSFEELPNPDVHPVLIARQMLIFASLLQQLEFKQFKDCGLSEAPDTIMQRLADTAIRLVTANEELTGTAESLECIVLEGMFHGSCGNLRRAWLAFRRAVTAGQLMGIHRSGSLMHTVDPTTTLNPQVLWFRIVCMDRALSMLLGLPQGTSDRKMGCDAAIAGDTPIGRLERTHAVIASHILERREDGALGLDYKTTREFDEELLRVANNIPGKFWLPPTFLGFKADIRYEFKETLRVVNQLAHYDLISQLHLPYMLRFATVGEDQYQYSRMACVNANREILTRFLAYSNFKLLKYCCRRIDVFTLTACLTLLLCHLVSHRPVGDNSLTHQRHSDRAMTEQALENIRQLRRVDEAAIVENGLNILRCLLRVEAEAADGRNFRVQLVQRHTGLKEDPNTLLMSIPSIGVIMVTRSDEASQNTNFQFDQCELARNDQISNAGSAELFNHIFSEQEPSAVLQTSEIGQFHGIEDNTTTPYMHPTATASIEDWAFQGVDMSFLDSIIHISDSSQEWPVTGL
ncbi:hypothetical protein BBP40_009334 [Aspergillus hancockii]|nr:hypothetical protein BBP40_009334 [Aspergillus hancockii]